MKKRKRSCETSIVCLRRVKKGGISVDARRRKLDNHVLSEILPNYHDRIAVTCEESNSVLVRVSRVYALAFISTTVDRSIDRAEFLSSLLLVVSEKKHRDVKTHRVYCYGYSVQPSCSLSFSEEIVTRTRACRVTAGRTVNYKPSC